jgi:hypothetical protein
MLPVSSDWMSKETLSSSMLPVARHAAKPITERRNVHNQDMQQSDGLIVTYITAIIFTFTGTSLSLLGPASGPPM